MIVNGFGRENAVVNVLEVVKAHILDTSENVCTEVELCVVPLVCSPIWGQSIELARETYDHLVELQLADNTGNEEALEVDILIGGDLYWRFVSGRVKRGVGGPVAVHTSLGWVLSGEMEKSTLSSNAMLTHVMTVGMGETEIEENHVEDMIRKMWEADSVESAEENKEDAAVKWEEKIKFDGARYTVSLPWKQEISTIPDNYALCVRRLHVLLKRLKKNPKLLEQYDRIIKDQEVEGIIENADDIREIGCVHYLPHREVVRYDKDTTKVRMVYDCSARLKNQVSLNDCLEKGGSLLPKIFDVLVRFRSVVYAVVSDIRSAFLNIRIDAEDRDFLRFLWVSSIQDENPKIITKRLTSVLFGLISSPYLLGITIKTHMEKFLSTDEEVVVAFLRDLYADNDVSGAQSFEKAFNLYLKSKELMKCGGFQLRKWETNDDDLREKIRRSEEEVFCETDSVKSGDEIKILGVRWWPGEDVLKFSMEEIVEGASDYGVLSKRYVLKIMSSIFDPLGVWAPATIMFKLLFQELCCDKVAWDSEVSEEIRKKWEKLLKSVGECEEICIPRNYIAGWKINDVARIELHGFGDASGKAYACVIYLRAVFASGEVVCRFVAAKTRVNPPKKPSMPRLELMACLLLSTLMKTVVSSIVHYKIDQIYCWTDSLDCVYWINTYSKVWERFIQNRVNKVRHNLPEVTE